jgi:hypothetical protein
VVSARSRSTALGGGLKAPQQPSSQHTAKRKANELASSGNSNEPTNRHPAPAAGPAPLPTTSSVTGKPAAFGSWQLGPPGRGVTYTAVLAGPVVLSQPNGSLMPTAMDSDLSEPAVSSETPNRHTSSNMSGPLIDKSDGTTQFAHVANTCLPA